MTRKNILIVVFIALTFSVFSIVLNNHRTGQTKEKQGFSLYRTGSERIYNLSEDEQKQVLEAFDVKIPENETNAYVYSFGKKIIGGNRKDDVPSHVYFMEIDKVNGYSAFYSHNFSRGEGNGFLPESDNELFISNKQNEYLTYSFWHSIDTENKEDKLIFNTLTDLFDKISQEHRLEERTSSGKS